MTKKLAVGAVAATMLTIPGAGLAAVADSAAVGATALASPANQIALAQPFGLAPVATRLGACMTHVRLVKARGPAGGHYAGTCSPQSRWVPAVGPAGGHYDYAANSCVRWVGARGPAGGHYVGTCSPQARWVPAHGPRGGHYVYAGASTTQSSTKPTATATEESGAPSWGFDWESAGIGAAGIIGALALALAGISGLRSRRIAGPGTP